MERKENKVRFCARSEVLADWKWLLTYSRRCKKMIALYIALGVLGTTVGLFGSVAGKYLIDIVTGYDTARLPLLVFAAIGSTAVSIAFDCVVSRVLKKLEIDLNNNVRADVFDRILDANFSDGLQAVRGVFPHLDLQPRDGAHRARRRAGGVAVVCRRAQKAAGI